MPTLRLTIGLPCSGKTTRAKQLEAEHNAIRFTPDEWHLRLFGDDVGQPVHDARHSEVERIMWDVGSRALQCGVNVVIDFGLWSLEERDEFRARAKALDCECVLHVCDVPEDELYRRLHARNAAAPKGVFQIPDSEMAKFIAVYQPPKRDEPGCVFESERLSSLRPRNAIAPALVRLDLYDPAREALIRSRMAQFFGFHHALTPDHQSPADIESLQDGKLQTTLTEWLTPPSHLYSIMDGDVDTGFLRICYRGPSVAWIEDIFVDPDHRGKGLATGAILAAEQIIKATQGYTAVCLDVAPRNRAALALYHKLGYADLSLVTVRKELIESRRDRPVMLFGLDYRY